MPAKREVRCTHIEKVGLNDVEYCREILKLISPDDEHTEVSTTKPKYQSIEEQYTSKRGHLVKVYWYHTPLVVKDL